MPGAVGLVILQQVRRHLRDGEIEMTPLVFVAHFVGAGRKDRLVAVRPKLDPQESRTGEAWIGVEEKVVGGLGASPEGVRVSADEFLYYVVGLLGIPLHVHQPAQQEAHIAGRVGLEIPATSALVPIIIPARPHWYLAIGEQGNYLESHLRVIVEILQGRHKYSREAELQSVAGTHREGDETPVLRQKKEVGQSSRLAPCRE